jgi:hypothetical protein
MGAERPDGKPDPLGKPRRDPRKGAGARQGQAPERGRFPYLDTLGITRFYINTIKPPNYAS